MAAKLSLVLLAASLAFLLAADASFFRTTVSEVEELNPIRGSSCERQLEDMSLTPCMNWMQGSPGRRDFKGECCNMMSKMDHECRCRGLKEMMNDKCSGSRFSHQGEEEMCGSMMREKMMELPTMCNPKFKSCEFNMILV